MNEAEKIEKTKALYKAIEDKKHEETASLISSDAVDIFHAGFQLGDQQFNAIETCLIKQNWVVLEQIFTKHTNNKLLFLYLEQENTGKTILQLAIDNNLSNIAAKIIDCMGQFNENEHLEFLKIAKTSIAHRIIISLLDSRSLEIAASKQNWAIVEIFLNAREFSSENYCNAAKKAVLYKKWDFAQKLISRCGDLRKAFKQDDLNSMLIDAIKDQQHWLVMPLLQSGADQYANKILADYFLQNNTGETILKQFISSSQIDIAAKIINCIGKFNGNEEAYLNFLKITLDSIPHKKIIPLLDSQSLEIAAVKQNWAIMEKLLKFRQFSSENYCKAAKNAILYKNQDLAEKLILLSDDLRKGFTQAELNLMLIDAIRCQKLWLVLRLLESGADPNTTDSKNSVNAASMAKKDPFFSAYFNQKPDAEEIHYMKSLRTDRFNFDGTLFIPGITRSEKQHIPLRLRPKRSRRFSLHEPLSHDSKKPHLFHHKLIHPTREKPRKYAKELTRHYSGPQSVTLISPKHFSPDPFGFGTIGTKRDEIYGVFIKPSPAAILPIHLFYVDSGTVHKEYQFTNAHNAYEFLKKNIFTDNPQLFFDVNDLENALKNGTAEDKKRHNEILARLKLDKDNWSLFVGQENLESKLLAQNLGRRLRAELKKLYQEATPPLPWDDNFRFPIYYYNITGKPELQYLPYHIFDQAKTRKEAEEIAADTANRYLKYSNYKFEFLLGLNASKINDLLLDEHCGGVNLFIYILQSGYVHIVQSLLEIIQKTNPNFLKELKDKHPTVIKLQPYQDALYHCSRAGDVRLVNWLLSCDWKKNSAVSTQATLVIACRNGHLGVVKSLLQKNEFKQEMAKGFYLPKAGKTQSTYAKTPLMIAAKYGHLDIVKALIYHGDNINAENLKKNTAFMYAAEAGRIDIVEYFLKNYRSSINITSKNTDGNDALSLAIKRGHPDVAIRLLQDKKLSDHMRTCADCIEKKLNVAIAQDDMATLKAVIDLSKGNTSENEKYYYYLSQCLWLEWESRTKEHPNDNYTALKKYFAEIKSSTLLSNPPTYTAFCNNLLKIASDHNKPGIIELLLSEENKFISVNTIFNQTFPLKFSAEHGHFDLAKKVLDMDECISTVVPFVGNAFVEAALYEHNDIIKLLLTHSTSATIKDNSKHVIKYLQKYPEKNKALIELVETLKDKPLNEILYEVILSNNLSPIAVLLEDLDIKPPFPNTRNDIKQILKKLSGHYNSKMFDNLLSYAYVNKNTTIIPDLLELGANINPIYHLSSEDLFFAAFTNKNYNFILTLIKFSAAHHRPLDEKTLNQLIKGIIKHKQFQLLEETLKHYPLSKASCDKIIEFAQESRENWNLIKTILLNIENFINKDQLIYLAIRHGDSDTVKKLLEKGINFYARDRHGDTPMQDAAKKKQWDILKLLAEKCPDALDNTALANEYGSVLIQTVEKKQYSISSELLNKNANVDCENSFGHAPLIYAIHHKNSQDSLNILSCLLEKKAKLVNSRNNLNALKYARERENWAALDLIVKYRHEELDTKTLNELLLTAISNNAEDLINTLYDLGDKLNLKTDEQSLNNLIDTIIKHRQFQLLEKTLKHYPLSKASCDKIIEFGDTYQSNWNLIKNILLNTENFISKDQLSYLAIQYDDIDTVKKLLEKGINFSAKNKQNESPIQVAAKRRQWGILKLLVAKSPDALNHPVLPEEYGVALLFSTDYKQYNISIELLNKNANTEHADENYGFTPLLLTIKDKNSTYALNFLSILLQKKAKLVNIGNKNLNALKLAEAERNWAALNLIVKYRHEELDTKTLNELLLTAISNNAQDLINTLYDLGDKLNLKTDEKSLNNLIEATIKHNRFQYFEKILNHTPLPKASCDKIIEFAFKYRTDWCSIKPTLLKLEGDINNQLKEQLIFLAIKHSDCEATKTLLEKNVNFSAKNTESDSPIAAAVTQEKWQVVECLVEKCPDAMSNDTLQKEYGIALYRLATKQKYKLATDLLNKSASSGITLPSSGLTPLLLAIKDKYSPDALNFISLLLQKKAKITNIHLKKLNALTIAKEEKNWKALSLIIKYRSDELDAKTLAELLNTGIENKADEITSTLIEIEDKLNLEQHENFVISSLYVYAKYVYLAQADKKLKTNDAVSFLKKVEEEKFKDNKEGYDRLLNEIYELSLKFKTSELFSDILSLTTNINQDNLFKALKISCANNNQETLKKELQACTTLAHYGIVLLSEAYNSSRYKNNPNSIKILIAKGAGFSVNHKFDFYTGFYYRDIDVFLRDIKNKSIEEILIQAIENKDDFFINEICENENINLAFKNIENKSIFEIALEKKNISALHCLLELAKKKAYPIDADVIYAKFLTIQNTPPNHQDISYCEEAIDKYVAELRASSSPELFDELFSKVLTLIAQYPYQPLDKTLKPFDFFSYLLNKKYVADIKKEGGKALWYAALHGNAEQADKLIQAGVELNFTLGGRNVLTRAACSGSLEIVKHLLAFGACPELTKLNSDAEKTACNNPELKKILETAKDKSKDLFSETLLNNDINWANQFSQNPTLVIDFTEKNTNIMANIKSTYNKNGNYNLTTKAFNFEELKALQIFVEKAERQESKKEKKENAFFKYPELFFAKFIFIQHKDDLAEKNKSLNDKSRKEITDKLYTESVKLLSDLKSVLYNENCPEPYNDFCYRLLLLCAQFNCISLFHRILGNCEPDFQYKPLTTDPKRIQFYDIINFPACKDAPTTLQNAPTPLMLAATHGNASMVDKLIYFNADTKCIDINGKTALIHATENEHFTIGEKLIAKELETPILTVDKQNKTALDYVKPHLLFNPPNRGANNAITANDLNNLLIQKSYQELDLDSKNFIQKLRAYCDNRLSKIKTSQANENPKDVWDTDYYTQYGKFSAKVKIQTAEKLIRVIEHGSKFNEVFNQTEIDAMNQGDLGKAVSPFKNTLFKKSPTLQALRK